MCSICEKVSGAIMSLNEHRRENRFEAQAEKAAASPKGGKSRSSAFLSRAITSLFD
jgi:hypothetical protein